MKRKLYAILLAGCMVFSLAACGGTDSSETSSVDEGTQTEAETQETEQEDAVSAETKEEIATEQNTESSAEASSVLIAYFGRWGNTEFPENVDATTSASIVIDNEGNLMGTTEVVAGYIQQAAGGDLHLIQTAEPYPEDYDTVVSQNHQEQEDGYLPELAGIVENMDQYDTVYIGYPVWATSLPQAVVSFLNQYDFSGKTIIPFCTHGGYGSGDTYESIQELCTEATVLEGYAVSASDVADAETEVPDWIAGLGITEMTE